MTDQLLEVKNLVKYFPIRRGLLSRMRGQEKLNVRAVDHVSVNVEKNETLGLVGESGSGKSTLGRTILMLERLTSGQIVFQGRDITELRGEELRRIRKKMQIVFQNPNLSLDPRQRVQDIISEPLRAFGGSSDDAMKDSVSRVLNAVGLLEDSVTKFPHQFSGGQRQRIAVARALVLTPEFMVLDEPTSALDSSVQAQILNLLRKIQEEFGMGYLFITHNVNVVKYMADRIAVMYCGKLVEVGKTHDVLESPIHPYTAALIVSVPQPDPQKPLARTLLVGEIPSSINPPSGCRFHPRCPFAQEICSVTEPELRVVTNGHLAACHFAEEVMGKSAPGMSS